MLFLLLILPLVAARASKTGVYIDHQYVNEPGVCEEIKKIPYTTYENRQVTDTRKAWCWDISRAFRCDVVYQRWESVPVSSTRDVRIAVCCEGYHQDPEALRCVANSPTIDEQVAQSIASSKESDKEAKPAPDAELDLQLLDLAKDLFEARATSAPPLIERAAEKTEATHHEEVVQSPDTAAPAEMDTVVKVVPVEAQSDDKIADTVVDKGANPEAMAIEIAGIFAKELLKDLVDTPKTEIASTDTRVPTEGSNSERLRSPMLQIEQALLKTMSEMSKAHLRALSRLRSVFTLLRRQAPRRGS